MSTHQEQAQRIADQYLTARPKALAAEIRAALDAAARTALEEAVDDPWLNEYCDLTSAEIRQWLRARAASLGEQKSD